MRQAIPPEAEDGRLPGVIALGDRKDGDLISEYGLADLCNRSVSSVKRAVKKGELPEPVELFGNRVWTVGSIRTYIGQRIAEAQDERKRDMSNVTKLKRR